MDLTDLSSPAARHARGFSLLEVLIAVVVLATGLLALASLQGSLTRSSADAKIQGRVAAMLSARMDELRGGGYGTIGAGSFTSTSADACDPSTADGWLHCTREQANLDELDVDQTVETWYGTGSFTTPAPATEDPRVAQFKRVTLTASWTDATGVVHRLSDASDVSSLALTNFLVPPPEDETTAGAAGPVVRTIDPATAGVIPIALGDSAESSTSNPTPELVGQKNNQKVVGTRFTVLNYTPPSSSAVVIQKRFENEVIKCACQFGAGGDNFPAIYRTAQWPAVWTGERYDLYQPASPTDAPGQAKNAGPRPDVRDDESPLCQECCRDHHDTDAVGVARFDPERLNNIGVKYRFNTNDNTLVPQNDTLAGIYVDACRVIRVDGFWRTASDMYARQFGLLETETVGGAAAKTGVPTPNAVKAYTTFVKGYLRQYDGSSANSPANGQLMFDGTTGVNAPSVVAIATASNSDYRYLHARGLYVDYLEEQARTKLQKVLADTGPQGLCPSGSNIEDCVMPYLPFVTVNLTEIAKWLASDKSILTVDSGNMLATCADGSSPCPQYPSGGRTIGKKAGAATTRATMRLSNSGVAVNALMPIMLGGVDTDDDTDTITDEDNQDFTVGGGSTGSTFDVRVSGGGGNPFVFFTLGTDLNTECLKPANSDNHCVTASGTTLPQAGTVKVSNYGMETTIPKAIPNGTCVGQTRDITVNWPVFRNYVVTGATVSGTAGTIAAPVNDNRTSEYTTISFAAIPAGGLVLVTLSEQAGSPTYAALASCTTNGGGNQIKSITWTTPYPWS